MARSLHVEVAFAMPGLQLLETVTLEPGATLQDAIERSGIEQRFPDEGIAALPTGIWGRPAERARRLEEGDRVEIYRPLEIDPRDARRRLARAGETMTTGKVCKRSQTPR